MASIKVKDATLLLVLLARRLVDHGVGGLQAGGPNDVTDLSAIDLTVQLLIVEVEDLLELWNKDEMWITLS